jgi:hypothetical protein
MIDSPKLKVAKAAIDRLATYSDFQAIQAYTLRTLAIKIRQSLETHYAEKRQRRST